MSHIITNMDELTLSSTNSTASTVYRRPMCETQSSVSLIEVTHLHTEPEPTVTFVAAVSLFMVCLF